MKVKLGLNLKPVIVIHYSEIALKGKNRPFFEKKLLENIQRALVQRALVDKLNLKIKKLHDRLVVELPAVSTHWSVGVKEKLEKVFGIENFGIGWQVPAIWGQNDFEAKKAHKFLEELAGLIADKLKAPPARRLEPSGDWRAGKSYKLGSFKIETKRADKRFPLSSLEISQKLGAILQKASKTQVDLKNPQITVFIELTPYGLFFYWDKFQGPGGLPISTAGKVLVLLSGGIDSPVAAWQIMRRGARVDFIHFHSYPFTSKKSQRNVEKLAKVLAGWQGPCRLYLVPFGAIQKRIVASGEQKLLVLLYRRAMMKLAESIALKSGILALVTGESLGQVASQTLENLQAVGRATQLQILRPLIGLDKKEIIEKARAIGTYDISIQPYEDCCSLFVPAHPALRASEVQLEQAEKKVAFGRSPEKAFQEAKIIDL
jgi:thiamine biosynthesis protein ThiI